VGDQRSTLLRDRTSDLERGQGIAAQVGTYFGVLAGGRGGVVAGVALPPQGVDSTCGEALEPVEVTRTPVEQSVGPEECRTFLVEPLAHLFGQGIELSHRSTSGSGRKAGTAGRSGIRQERRSALRGNSRRRPGDGDGGVGEPAGSRGASPSLLTEGLLVLIPSRGPHPPNFRSCAGPAGARAGTESQPACRRGRGSRVADGFRGGVGRP
jgi:hypothetical protein